MHIITGLALAGIAKLYAAKNAQEAPLPRFQSGPLRVRHAIEGRLRLQAPALRGARLEQVEWPHTLEQLPGIETVRVNAVTGSILIRYRGDAIEPMMIFEAVARMLGVEEELHHPPPPRLLRELRDVGDGLNRAVYDGTSGALDLWTLLVVGLAAMGIKKVVENGWDAFPAGFTLLWWALHVVSHSEAKAL